MSSTEPPSPKGTRRAAIAKAKGGGAIAQGTKAKAAGKRGVVVDGPNIGNVTTGPQIKGDEVRGDKIAGSKIRTQVNSHGGAVFLRGVAAQTVVGRDQITQYVSHGSLPIVWPKEGEQRYLQRVQDEFVASLRTRTVQSAEREGWDAGYIQPLLSCRRIATARPAQGGQRTETKTGTWSQIATSYPQVGVLVGDTHSGRSFLLRWIVADLARGADARRDSDLPIYLQISKYPFEDARGLLDAAAFACGQQPETMRDYWYNTRRRICLAIDDADQIPSHQRDAFARTLTALNASRGNSHSIILACRPENGSSSIPSTVSSVFEAEPAFAQWIMLPLDDGRISQLLDCYGADHWLKSLIAKNERLRWLVRHPGALADLVHATRGLYLINPPQNLAQLYQLFVDGYLFSDVQQGTHGGSEQRAGRYHYGRVKQKLLAYLAFRMLASAQQNGIAIDDPLCRDLATQLDKFASEFSRTRRYMPDDWNATDALLELFESPVVDRDAARADQFEFTSQAYRDYYAAIYLRDIGQGWQQAGEVIRGSNLEGWTDALILLSGMPPTDTTNEIFNYVLAREPSLAADLWLEKGTVGFTKVPECVERSFYERRIVVPERLDYRVHSAVAYFSGVIRDSRPEVALQAVNGLMQLGVDAIDPLLDAVKTGHPLVVASAIHALFHMGRSMVDREVEVKPLIVAVNSGFTFNNMGACNATIGNFVLVNVPRTMQAELTATFGHVDFDLFNAPCSFELWHTPVAWFAIDYFKRVGRVDWVGLAAACDTVVRCAGLIVGKALLRESMQPIVQEMTQCAITYDRLGQCIASDLDMKWSSSTPSDAPPELTETAEQIYKELRLFFNRANRARMLGGTVSPARTGRDPDLAKVEVNQDVREISGSVLALDIDELSVEPTDVADLPDLIQLRFDQTVDTVSPGGVLRGMYVRRIAPAPFQAAEVVSLSGNVIVAHCREAAIEGVTIDTLSSCNGVRAKLELTVGHMSGGRVIGISASAPPEAIQQPADATGALS